MRDLKIYIALATTLFIFYLVAQYNRPIPVDWSPTFSKKDKIPFGTYVIYNHLNDILPASVIKPKREAPYIVFTESTLKSGNYLLIAQRAKVDGYDFREMREYMYKGNNVFIASFLLSSYFTDSLKLNVSTERKFNFDEKIPVSFVNPALNPNKKYVFDRGIGDQYFSEYDSSKAVVLGINGKGHPNFIKYQYGAGALYLMASPMFFTNYNMLKPQGAEYVAKALSYLPTKSEIIWDEFSALGSSDDGQSPLRVFLSIEPLKWAYFITLFSLIAFVVYEVKRRQRIIPVIAPLQNSSAEFVKIVGQVYYQQRNNSNIAHKKISYLLEDIRSKYAIRTNILNQEFAELLAAKSGVQKEFAIGLIPELIKIKNLKQVSDQELITLNKHIEQFHLQSKK